MDLFELEYFSILDFGLSILFLMLLFIRINKRKKENQQLDYYKYYSLNIYTKLILSVVFSLYYIVIVDGGDTLAYWDSAVKMNNLFWKSPSLYFQELFSNPKLENCYAHFDMIIGYPPRWIYFEKESWFVAKILSILSFITFKSYLFTTLLLAYISSIASWKLFELVHSYQLNTDKNIALAVLFIPSVSFWCSGITKDTVVLFTSIFTIYHSFQLITPTKKRSYKNVIWLALYLFILSQIRSFMIIAIAIPLLLTIGIKIMNTYKNHKKVIYSIRFTVLIIGILCIYFQGDKLLNSSQLQDAAAIQKDMAINKTYLGVKYDIGMTDFGPIEILKAFPSAIIAGLYRPFIWESMHITLILNGLEGVLFLYLTFLFFRRDFIKKLEIIKKHEFYIFCLIFCILMAYMSGITAGLLGVLVRFKSILIPFFVILLTINSKSSIYKIK